ncbi:squamosa promoter-binding-like protein 7 [Brachypodium distachyon]|uniref:SBP-type domain-containing protein n=1 Tax=Brachypodium distachyon TaxID=15368 RepID=A0A0Q3P560_BRADI|nr:squamosa promoter-binding-like protein 7 [Brachypodium distachyon]KQJ83945.1 hypothetical protein BRADI_5g17722v3 [Brachypodium distachyon]|eukprot:XP_003581504.2 squamosa promoter-binding-like protein 7 [Brachypodium distachyon]
MEGDGGAGHRATAPWDLGMQWAPPPATSAYPQHFMPPPPPAAMASAQRQQQELTSLKLGKRPCYLPGWRDGQLAQVGAAGHVDVNGGRRAVAAPEGKRKEKAAAATATAAVARCQVEGCHLALAGAKEYHRRHKVCEAHSKAPRVVVHGAEQRFCQQCSRFHAMSEFDDAKRSCRRRLAGHNERRRKSNASEAMARGSAHTHGVTSLVHLFAPYGALLPASPAGALSLLSSARAAGATPWQLIPTAPDAFPAGRSSSAALDELIAENRAALLACHFFPDRSGRGAESVPGSWQHAHAAPPPAPAGHVTLDLMQAPTAGGLLRPTMRTPDRASSRPAEDIPDDEAGRGPGVWAPLQGAHVA